MHSFHQSRGRILFEVLCALAVSASCVGAWMQTQASALLGAAFATALYALWHLTDMRRPKPAVAGFTETIEPVDEVPGELLDRIENAPVEIPPAPIAASEPALGAEELSTSEPPAAEKAKRPRKPRAKKAAKPQEMPVEATAPEAPMIEPLQVEPLELVASDEDRQPIEPLFEPEPFVRQHRAVFGRKAAGR